MPAPTRSQPPTLLQEIRPVLRLHRSMPQPPTLPPRQGALTSNRPHTKICDKTIPRPHTQAKTLPSGQGPELEADLVNLASPCHSKSMKVIDQPLRLGVRIDKHPALNLVEAIQALRLKFSDHRVHRTRHVGIDFAMGEALLRCDDPESGRKDCNEFRRFAPLRPKHIPMLYPHWHSAHVITGGTTAAGPQRSPCQHTACPRESFPLARLSTGRAPASKAQSGDRRLHGGASGETARGLTISPPTVMNAVKKTRVAN
jgi:hypothetical protein